MLTRRSTGALLATALLLTAQLGAAVHLATVRHALCVYHGDVVHVSAAATDEILTAGPSAAQDATDAHDDCALALLSERTTLSVAHLAFDPPAPPVAVPAPDLRRYADPLLARRRYGVAPKQSPPA